MKNKSRVLWYKNRQMHLWLVGICLISGIAALTFLAVGITTNNDPLQLLAAGGMVIVLILGIIGFFIYVVNLLETKRDG